MKIKFNKKNKYYDCKWECCNEIGIENKNISSIVFCSICNLFVLRKLLKINSFCRKYGWDKNCKTCKERNKFNEENGEKK